MLNSRALTKIQSIFLIGVVAVAGVTIALGYCLFASQSQPSKAIKIGILADLDGAVGSDIWQSSVLAAEQLNAEGGILGKQIEVIGEDTDEETSRDLSRISSALTRLLTLHNVDFVLGIGSGEKGYLIQELSAEHKKIIILLGGSQEGLTQRVIDEYDKYKYFFRYGTGNTTNIVNHYLNQFLYVREITGFNNIGYLADDSGYNAEIREVLNYMLPEVYGFNLVYKGTFPPFDTIDFSSYFAAAEEAEVEILFPLSVFDSGIPLVKEYYDRQSPMIFFGGMIVGASLLEGWERTDGKCVYTTMLMNGANIGYPITSKTLQFFNSYNEKWGEAPSSHAVGSYDVIRFILSDAIERAGTTETEEIIKTLEKTDVETAGARKFAFTSSHDALYREGMIDSSDDYGITYSLFQWQEDGSLVPIFPKWLMEEAGAIYTFPDWPGPWDEK